MDVDDAHRELEAFDGIFQNLDQGVKDADPDILASRNSIGDYLLKAIVSSLNLLFILSFCIVI